MYVYVINVEISHINPWYRDYLDVVMTESNK